MHGAFLLVSLWALTEMGLDASERYHMSRADQTALIGQATNKTLSDQSVGELARLVEGVRLTDEPDYGMVKKFSNEEVRRMYVDQVSKIHESIDPSLPLEERALLAFEARNSLRTQARDHMADTKTRKILDENKPNLSFDDLLKSKMERKGLTREETLQDIYITATTTNQNVNSMFGIGVK